MVGGGCAAKKETPLSANSSTGYSVAPDSHYVGQLNSAAAGLWERPAEQLEIFKFLFYYILSYFFKYQFFYF